MLKEIAGRDETVEVKQEELRVGYQGEPGAYGQIAAAAHGGVPQGFASFEKVIEALRDGLIDEAVLPIENAVVGAITEALEPLANYVAAGLELVAVGLTSVPVRLALAARPGTPLGDVKRAWSQAPALRQCTHRLTQMGIERVVCYDTAAAAQIVAHDASTDAAICSRTAAERYGLEVLVEDVSDKEQNGTRFAHLRMAEHARAQVPLAFLRTSSMTATARLDVLTGATLLPLAGNSEFPVRMWVLGADAARLQALAPARDVQVISLGQPAAHAARHVPPKQGTEPVIKSLPHATARKPPTVVEVGPWRVGAGSRAVIAGPCSVETAEQVMRIAKQVAACGASALRGGIFKPRTNPYAFQGHGLEALDWLVAAGKETGLPVVTEVMAVDQVKPVAEKADVLQIGARNMQNFDLLRAVGRAGRPVLLKRGAGATVDEWLGAAEYVMASGETRVVLCERGIRTFETSTRNTLDVGGMLAARPLTHLPILADPSHAAGRADLVEGLARAAWAAGADGLIVEVHDDPARALSDAEQALVPQRFAELARALGLNPDQRLPLAQLRAWVDAIDADLAHLVHRRLEVAKVIGASKRQTGRAVLDPRREAAVRRTYHEALPGERDLADRLVDLLILAARQQQSIED
ncbi:MAG: 3-deoxy-7-phosphoheptulonate synthase [Deltaproteobacteria bacterium]|nr:MAG: 3-deoxy-7-phosphoheptulonate synthase [Deltaproteobacteria bacterium]